MLNILQPSFIFIQSNVLFVADTTISKQLKDFFPKDKQIKSLSLPILWEISEDGIKNDKTLLLHLDFPEPLGLLTVMFQEEQFQHIKANKNTILSLGILDEYDEITGDAKRVLFITDIADGLKLVLQNSF